MITFVAWSFSNLYDGTFDFICRVNYTIARSNIFKQLMGLSNFSKIQSWRGNDTCCMIVFLTKKIYLKSTWNSSKHNWNTISILKKTENFSVFYPRTKLVSQMFVCFDEWKFNENTILILLIFHFCHYSAHEWMLI